MEEKIYAIKSIEEPVEYTNEICVSYWIKNNDKTLKINVLLRTGF